MVHEPKAENDYPEGVDRVGQFITDVDRRRIGGNK